MLDRINQTSKIPEIPDSTIESLARCLLPHIQKFYESIEGKREFAGWQEQQKREKEDIGLKS